MSELTHKQLIASMDAAARSALTQKSDYHGLVQSALHLGLVAAGAVYVYSGLPLWWLVLPVHGLVMAFLFCALHEAVHKTPFKTPWLNDALATICGVITFIPPTWFRYFHLAHHRYTHDPERDPELAYPKPDSLNAYLLHITGLPEWVARFKGLYRRAAGHAADDFIPRNMQGRVIVESRAYAILYMALIGISIHLETAALFWMWVLPSLLGNPFLRLYLLAEHTGCDHSDNMLINSRTVTTHPLVRFIAWNMPYHVEHHSYPGVPFYLLPTFHHWIKDSTRYMANGYRSFHQSLVNQYK